MTVRAVGGGGAGVVLVGCVWGCECGLGDVAEHVADLGERGRCPRLRRL